MSKKEERTFEPKGHLVSLFPSIPDVMDKNQMTLTHIQRLTCGSAIQNNKWATRGCPISLSPSQQQSLKARPEFFHAWFVGCKLIVAALCWCKENEFRNLPSVSSSPTVQMHQQWLPLAELGRGPVWCCQTCLTSPTWPERGQSLKQEKECIGLQWVGFSKDSYFKSFENHWLICVIVLSVFCLKPSWGFYLIFYTAHLYALLAALMLSKIAWWVIQALEPPHIPRQRLCHRLPSRNPSWFVLCSECACQRVALTIVPFIRDESLSYVWWLRLKPQNTQEDSEFKASWDYIVRLLLKGTREGRREKNVRL